MTRSGPRSRRTADFDFVIGSCTICASSRIFTPCVPSMDPAGLLHSYLAELLELAELDCSSHAQSATPAYMHGTAST
jgi:hypothetical protein